VDLTQPRVGWCRHPGLGEPHLAALICTREARASAEASRPLNLSAPPGSDRGRHFDPWVEQAWAWSSLPAEGSGEQGPSPARCWLSTGGRGVARPTLIKRHPEIWRPSDCEIYASAPYRRAASGWANHRLSQKTSRLLGSTGWPFFKRNLPSAAGVRLLGG